MRYGPISYADPGRVYPRDRLRDPFPRRLRIFREAPFAPAPPPLPAPVRYITIRGRDDTHITVRGNQAVAVFSAIACFAHEDVVLTVNLPAGAPTAGWGLQWTLYTAWGSPVLAFVGPDGIAIGGNVLVVSIPAAITDQPSGLYYWSLSRTDVNSRAMISFGTLNISPARAV